MTATGTISGNLITLDQPAGLPEGARVSVVVHPRREELSVEERVALAREMAGSMPATADQVKALLEEDYYGVE